MALEQQKNFFAIMRALILLLINLLVMLSVLISAVQAEEHKLSDENITDAVEDELLYDAALFSQQLDVVTDNGVVTLSGIVEHLLAQQRAINIAKAVKGVRAVINHITVSPSNRADELLENEAQNALATAAATESYEIGVKVHQGALTLSGEVDSWQEKELAGRLVKHIEGVQQVNNDIVVDYQTQRADAEIHADIQAALKWDVYLNHHSIEVEVKEGHVKLSGRVNSALAKDHAVLEAKVSGVKSVDASELMITPLIDAQNLRDEKPVKRSDTVIQAAVEAALKRDARVEPVDIKVVVASGVVTLRGAVSHLQAKRAAAQDARNTVGVWRVVNRLKVRPQKTIDAEQLVKKVQHALQWDPYITDYEIGISSHHGEVTLRGRVDNYFEKAHAETVIARIQGVVDINNHLNVLGTEERLTTKPLIDEWSVYDFDWYRYNNALTDIRTDLEIRQAVEDQLWWSPFIDSDTITVQVDNGRVTLSGRVDTWSERIAATQNALEGGAVLVDNQLEVVQAPAMES